MLMALYCICIFMSKLTPNKLQSVRFHVGSVFLRSLTVRVDVSLVRVHLRSAELDLRASSDKASSKSFIDVISNFCDTNPNVGTNLVFLLNFIHVGGSLLSLNEKRVVKVYILIAIPCVRELC